jgi:hypothetical protein
LPPVLVEPIWSHKNTGGKTAGVTGLYEDVETQGQALGIRVRSGSRLRVDAHEVLGCGLAGESACPTLPAKQWGRPRSSGPKRISPADSSALN